MGKTDRPPQLSSLEDVNFSALLESALASADLEGVAIEKGDAVEGGRRSARRALGNYPEEPQGQIDLHECSVEQALFETERFIGRCRSEGLLTILVITGKGLHSEGGRPRIRPAVEEMLQRFKRSGTIADFKKAGGGGAFKVSLPKTK